MAKTKVRGVDEKEFVKKFDDICKWNSRWKRWNDMIQLIAIEISNAVDVDHRAERNESYIHIAKKYKPKEFEKFAELFACIVDALDRNPFQDFLGRMYMEMNFGNARAGQFFTPYDVCKMMALITMNDGYQKLQQAGYITINDPACGAGATLIAAAETLHEREINYQQRALFVAQDIDQTVALMCYIQLSLIGCAGYVRIGDTLADPMTGHVLFGPGDRNTWYTPMFFHETWHYRRAIEQTKMFFMPLPDEPEAAKASVDEQAIVEISGKKRRSQSTGQLMFDFEQKEGQN